MKKSKVLTIITALIIVLVLYFLLRPAKFEIVETKKDKAVEAVYATGSVESEIMYPLSSNLSAKLVELYADEGDSVKKDQVLARLDGAEYLEQEKQFKIREKYAHDQFLRTEKLFTQGAISIDEYNKMKSEWEALKAATNSAKSKYEYTVIKSLSDGVVIRRDGEVGQLIPSNQAIFWVAENGNLRVTAEVDEEEILKVKVGQKVLMQADALPNKVMEGFVSQITPRGDSISRSFRVRISLPKDSPLLIGMTVENNILIGEKNNVLLIPTSALNGNFVWVVSEDNKVSKRKIEIGVRGLEFTEVSQGLEFGQRVVNNPHSNIYEGMKVR